jgi:hypothetical protein
MFTIPGVGSGDKKRHSLLFSLQMRLPPAMTRPRRIKTIQHVICHLVSVLGADTARPFLLRDGGQSLPTAEHLAASRKTILFEEETGFTSTAVTWNLYLSPGIS